jgi:biopolymer transport protein TolQ
VQLWDAFLHTGIVGKSVLALLLLFSIASWGVIIVAAFRFRSAASASRKFVATFRSSRRLLDVHGATARTPASPLVGLFKAGYAEIDAQMSQPTGHAPTHLKSLPAVERSLQRAMRGETARLTRNLPFLATTASATPFIGLFGTVWGIMVAFGAIGTSGTTSIVAVAPGISEALINTAAGLFAAIPALVAYNYFIQKLRQARGEMEEFALELLNLAERNFT